MSSTKTLFPFFVILGLLLIHQTIPVVSDALTPVAQWGPSWTASCLQSTAVALSCTLGSEAAVLILLSTRSESTEKLHLEDNWQEVDGVRLKVHRNDQLSLVDPDAAFRRWTLLGSSAVVLMTGLEPDIDYLSRFLGKHVEDNRVIYEGSRIMSTVEAVHALGKKLRPSASGKASRPFAVQCLFVGTNSNSDNLYLYTVDPSGSYRHWRCAAAIGKGAHEVRVKLHDLLLSRVGQHALDIHEAQDIILEALAKINARNGDSTQLKALVVWGNGSSAVSTASLDPTPLAKRYSEIFSQQASL